MQRKTNGPMEDAPQARRSSRRNLLKCALVFGAGVLIQPYGGISSSAFAQDVPKEKLSCSPQHCPIHAGQNCAVYVPHVRAASI